MDEHPRNLRQVSLEERSRALFHESVDGLDMRMRSRLTQARHAALEAAAASRRRPLFFGIALWRPAAGVTAAALLGVALWFGAPLGHHGAAAIDNQSSLEDLEIVASSDETSGDAMEMLQDDLEFYDWADKDANPGPAV